MIVLGLTGSIAMGKSTTAAMFRDLGVPVHDSDETVHRLYEGPAAAAIEARFPGTTSGGRVDRQLLSQRVLGDSQAMAELEAIVHPLVRDDETAFLEEARSAGVPLVVLDIPLLFESGGRNRVDAVVVVSADADIQRRRALARPGMTEQKFEAILRRQVPDETKRRNADFVIDTSHGLDPARAQVEAIRDAILAGGWQKKKKSGKD
jgi:dephospho-CoA kinase